MNGFSAGTAVEDITPPAGIRLSGFAGRPAGGNTGARDRLRAAALYLRDADDRAALIVTLDVIGLTRRDDARLRREAGIAAGVPPEAVLVACSHTHAGPATMSLRATGAREVAWSAVVRERAIRAAARARQATGPVDTLRAGVSDCFAAVNRRVRSVDGTFHIGVNPDGPRDPACRVLVLGRQDGTPTAALFQYAMHPVALGRGTLVSADWIAAARARIETTLGCPALFLNGCCGDVNPACGEGGARETDAAGEAVGEAALRAAHAALLVLSPVLRWGTAVARLPLRPLPSEEAMRITEERARATLARRDAGKGDRDVAHAGLDWVRACRRRHACPQSDILPARVSALRIGDGSRGVTLVGLPGEIFTEIGERIRAVVPNAWPVGYANGNVGYLYPDSALVEGGYEVDVAYRLYGDRQTGPGTAGALVTTASRAAERLR